MNRLAFSVPPFLAILLVVTSACGGSQLTRDDLKNQAQNVQSLAAEADTLASDTSEGKTLAPYTQSRAGELADEAQGLEQALQQPAQSNVAPAARQLGSACGSVSRLMDELQRSPDASTASRIKPDLDAIAHGVNRTAQRL